MKSKTKSHRGYLWAAKTPSAAKTIDVLEEHEDEISVAQILLAVAQPVTNPSASGGANWRQPAPNPSV
jgi:hypothetical protein